MRVLGGGGAFVLFLLIMIPLHSLALKKKLQGEKKVVMQIDEFIFLLAEQQYLLHVDTQALGGSPHIALMKTIFTKGDCDYIKSAKLILDNMHKVEQVLGRRVITESVERQFLSDLSSYKRANFRDKKLRILIAIPTLGIYALLR